LNIGGYYDHLIRFMNHAVDQEFLKPKHRALLIVEEEPDRLLDRFEPIIAANGAKRFERSRT
jgi:predicted Rossmann-fold nucleotide-binding protein